MRNIKKRKTIERIIKNEIEYFKPIIEREKQTTQVMREAWRKETVAQRIERVSLETYDLCKGKVLHGPFKGLQLYRDVWWGKSDLGAQCLGVYEKEILDLISTQEPFDTFKYRSWRWLLYYWIITFKDVEKSYLF